MTKLQERLYNEKSEPINHDLKNLVQTQDLKPTYLENSGFYIFSKNNFKENLNRITPYSKFYETSFPENIDIDDEEDFNFAESVLRNYQ